MSEKGVICSQFCMLFGVAFAISVSLFASANNLAADDAEAKPLLKTVDMATTELNEKQAKILDHIKKMPTTASVNVVKVQQENLDDNGTAVSVHLNPHEALKLKGYNVTEDKGSKMLEWKGEDPDETATLSLKGKSVTGLIFSKGKAYSVQPLGNGLQAIIRLDQSKFPKDHSPKAKK